MKKNKIKQNSYSKTENKANLNNQKNEDLPQLQNINKKVRNKSGKNLLFKKNFIKKIITMKIKIIMIYSKIHLQLANLF